MMVKKVKSKFKILSFLTGLSIILLTLLGIFHIVKALWDMDTLIGILYFMIALLFFAVFSLTNT